MLKYESFGGFVNYLSAVSHGVAWSTKKISLQQLSVSSSTDSTISTDISTTIRHIEIWIRVLGSSSVYIEIPLVDTYWVSSSIDS
ncbi:hypothetical protein M501DRAFT_1003711 [Patellaria atrata CBS 101060]|uniref:Uncharacterized protein n=1 Tax=Patellaria atrata CBS 101060 TaxID=1346257 RepID=A0A9P4VMY2_9PEZI|nr:hypothetical protein M501DRAFT_1003711 [Patellaria atrata CBS 101060]